VASAPTTPTQNLFNSPSNPPPVPPIPAGHQYVTSNILASESPNVISRFPPSSDKPLPPLLTPTDSRESPDTDDRSMVIVEKTPSQQTEAPAPTPDQRAVPRPDVTPTLKPTKRRSTSISEADKFKNSSPLSTPMPHRINASRGEDAHLSGILDDFKGQLSQFESSQNSNLDLKDPTTLGGRRVATRSKTDGVLLTTGNLNGKEAPTLRRATSSTPASPVLTISIPTGSLDESVKKSEPPSPIIPPRTTSLQQKHPVRGTRPSSVGPAGMATSPRIASSPLSSRRGSPLIPSQQYRGAGGLKAYSHRSSASSSEPSLIAAMDESQSGRQAF
jgi:hypothetical protein